MRWVGRAGWPSEGCAVHCLPGCGNATQRCGQYRIQGPAVPMVLLTLCNTRCTATGQPALWSHHGPCLALLLLAAGRRHQAGGAGHHPQATTRMGLARAAGRRPSMVPPGPAHQAAAPTARQHTTSALAAAATAAVPAGAAAEATAAAGAAAGATAAAGAAAGAGATTGATAGAGSVVQLLGRLPGRLCAASRSWLPSWPALLR